jgi:hypothetical protein
MLGQFKETDNPIEVKDYLKIAKLPDQQPLIHVYTKFDFADELTEYLYLSSLFHAVVLTYPVDDLQNLFLLTVVRTDASHVAGCIDELDNFDAKDIALICDSASHILYEEACSIYVKFFKPEHTTDKEEQVDM